MMKTGIAVTFCVFVINCAYVSSQDSPEGLWCPRDVPPGINASAEPDCSYYSNITCPPNQGCCGVSDRVNGYGYFHLCVELNEEPADCINDPQLDFVDGMSMKHGEHKSSCGSSCNCHNGIVNCGEKICLRAGDILSIIAVLGSILIAALFCICLCCYCSYKIWQPRRSDQTNASQTEDNPPSYKTAVRMPISISESISRDGISPPTYDEAVNIAEGN
ncbi:hypothetical protein HOLleu_40944 [Holothuria leucospilota]|uniref:Uncharacterized protein n=1 Tax=Holothuria leucospilota TaxID=206669 RepID=A0A9Q1BC20_HOLLE|nr:hypothetical protein HOLleu_40944 [Holothuria leucospilota]